MMEAETMSKILEIHSILTGLITQQNFSLRTAAITCICAAACRSLIRKWTADELRLRSMSCLRDLTSSHVHATCTQCHHKLLATQ